MKPSLVIVGLGNPGSSYAETRHNAGFQALDVLSEAFGQGPWTDKQKLQSQIQEARIITLPVLLAKPQTFMNLSGDAVRKIVTFYKLDPANQLLILSDDVDLPVGELRFRASGGPGTHNGLRSIALTYGTSFPRLRIGLGSPPAGSDLAAWVLSVPTSEERAALRAAYQKLPDMLRNYVLGQPMD